MTILDTRAKSTYPTSHDVGRNCAVDDCDQRSYLKQAFTAPEGHLVTVSVCRDHNGLRDILPAGQSAHRA